MEKTELAFGKGGREERVHKPDRNHPDLVGARIACGAPRKRYHKADYLNKSGTFVQSQLNTTKGQLLQFPEIIKP